MSGLFDLIGELFNSFFGFVVIIGLLQWIYRTFIANRNRQGRNDTLLRPTRALVNEYDMGASAIDSAKSILDVSASSRDYNSFTERDMYRTVIEETMTYSYGEKEKYENPKELYDSGIISFKEYMSMISSNPKGGKR
jgi:hypothetical protein